MVIFTTSRRWFRGHALPSYFRIRLRTDGDATSQQQQHPERSESLAYSLARSAVFVPGEFIIIKTVSLRVRSVYNRLIILKAVYLADDLHYNES